MDSLEPDKSLDVEKRVQLLFVKHESAIRVFVRALQPSLADADDILQETFLTISQKASSFDPNSNFVAWACTIARLKVLEHLRRSKRDTALSATAIEALAGDVPDLESNELRETALSGCLEKIAPKSRELLWRRYATRQTSDEIGTQLGMTPLAVRMALFKARAFLRACIGKKLKGAQ